MTEHVHDLAYTDDEDPDVYCMDTGCGKRFSPKEVFSRLNATERLSKSKADTAASLIRGHTVKDDLKAYIRELEGTDES